MELKLCVGYLFRSPVGVASQYWYTIHDYTVKGAVSHSQQWSVVVHDTVSCITVI